MQYQINEAIVFLEKLMIDKGTMKQIRQMICHPAIKQARIMPDCHKGMGCCVGFTSQLTDKIVPNFVGGDIGCGILTYPLGNVTKGKDKKIEKIEKKIRQAVPMGSNSVVGGPLCVFKEMNIELSDLEFAFQGATTEAYQFAKGYKQKYGVGNDFIQNDTMLITKDNIEIMLNDTKHPFGHGYCLAMALLDKEIEWNV